jgi:O-Antigen ligase
MRAVVLAVPLLLGPGLVALFGGGYGDTARLATGIAAWALLAAVAIALPRPLPRSQPAIAALAALAALTAWTAASLAWAPLGEPAGEDVQRLLAYVAALAAAIALLREPAAARLAEPLLLAGIAGATAYGLSERLVPGLVDLGDVLSAGDRLSQPLTYWNATGAFAALGLILAAGLVADARRSRATRGAAAAAAPVLGLALYLTFSRGALGALVAGLAVLLALAPTRPQLRAAVLVTGAAVVPALAALALPAVAREESGPAQGAAMLALLVVVAAVAAGLAGREPPRHRAVAWLRPAGVGVLALALVAMAVAVAQIERGGGRAAPEASPGRLTSVESNRYAYWRVAVRTFAEHPLRGVGSGGFQAEWLRERPFRESVRDAHSLYLETAAELGLVGAGLLLALLGGVAVAARRAGAASVAALAAFALHAGVDWDWELPALSLVAVVLAGLVLAGYQPGSPRGGG